MNYPFDDEKNGQTRYSESPDDKVFQQMSRAYSQVTVAGTMSAFRFMIQWNTNLGLIKNHCEIHGETRFDNLTTTVLIVERHLCV